MYITYMYIIYVAFDTALLLSYFSNIFSFKKFCNIYNMGISKNMIVQ